MGVHGLWQLLQATGQPVSLESLSGKVLAVDVSMWMHQSSKGLRDRHGNPLPNAHLIGLFRRLCKLLFYHIKPIVVFDGGVPQLKRQTLMNRRQLREEAVSSSTRSSKKLISKLLKYHAISNAMGESSGSQSTSSAGDLASKHVSGPPTEQDLFVLPPAPVEQPGAASDQSGDEDKQQVEDSSWEERLEQRSLYYEQMKELHKHNIESESFEALPLDVKHEILTDLKDANKRTDWNCISSLPKDAGDFSKFQLGRLVKQNKLTQLLENVRQEMNYSAGGLDSIVSAAEGATVESNRVMSDDTAQYVLIKNSASQEAEESTSKPDDTLETKEDTEEQQESNASSSKTYQMNNAFAIRKLAKDRNAGKKFAPVCVVNLSSSGSSSEEEEVIRQPQKKAKPISNPSLPPAAVSVSQIVTCSNVSLEQPAAAKSSLPLASVTSSQLKVSEMRLPGDRSASAASVTLSGREVKIEVSSKPHSQAAEIFQSQMKSRTAGDKYAGKVSVEGFGEASTIIASSQSNKLPLAGKSVKDEQLGRSVASELSQESRPEVKILSVSFNPSRIRSDDDLFPSSIFVGESSTKDSEAPSEEREVNTGSDNVDFVPNFGITEADEEADFSNPFAGMSEEGLIEMQQDLVSEAKELQSERGKQERLATGITNQMHADAQELLQLFGVPYLVSPMEAEAQCAYLDLTDQTDGTATDDSDIWLFGGRRVFKNLFNQGRDVEFYSIDKIVTTLALDRDLLVNIALLCGSDYTEGVQGVGPITALELLAEYPGKGFEKLVNFADWWRENRCDNGTSVKLTRLKSRLRSLEIRDGFPSRSVVEAYMNPTVDDSRESFSWGQPDVEGLREFARRKLSWGRGQTDELLLPMMKRRSKAIQVQTQLTNYFRGENHSLSKRLLHIVNKLRSGCGGIVPSLKQSRKQSQRRGTVKRKRAQSGSSSESESESDDENAGGFIRKRPAGRRRVIESDDENFDKVVADEDEISDTEMAQIDIDNMTSDVTDDFSESFG